MTESKEIEKLEFNNDNLRLAYERASEVEKGIILATGEVTTKVNEIIDFLNSLNKKGKA